MILCTHCGGSFAGALQLASHLDNSRACALAEYRSELDSLPDRRGADCGPGHELIGGTFYKSDEQRRADRRFATDPIQRNRAGNRRTEDKRKG